VKKEPGQNRILLLKTRIDRELHDRFSKDDCMHLEEPIRYILEAGGKRIRPLLTILCCQAVGGGRQDALEAALAVELLHTFTLVHDDFMDHDDLRRGRPSIHVRWDPATAVLTGDALLALAYNRLGRIRHPEVFSVARLFSQGLSRVCEGQAMDKDFEGRASVSMEDYILMIERKTAALIAMCCEIGVVLGGGTEAQKRTMRRFGLELGKAFQIQDDILDLWSDSSATGKPVGSDLLERKKSYPVVWVWTHGSPDAKRRFLDLWRKVSLGPEDVQTFRALFEETGARQAAD
jgi:geranylgeranyl diphosphate synthase type II